MIRVRISVGVLLLVIVTSGVSHFWIRDRCSELTRQAWTALEYMDEGNIRSAEETVDSLAEDWKSLRKKAGLFVRENKLLEVDRVCARITRLEIDDSGEAQAELSELTELLANIY